MKRILIILVLLPLLIGVTQVRASETTIDGVTIVETVTYENMPLMGLVSPDAVCKTQAHQIKFIEDGVVKAWTKIKLTNACWSVCLQLGNATRSHYASPGWSWSWGKYLLGARACKTDGIYRWTYDTVKTPYGYSYLAYHGAYLQLLKPLKFGWYSEVHPVIPGQ